MKFSKESLEYKKAVEELSEFKFSGTVYIIQQPFFLFEHIKKRIVTSEHGAGVYSLLQTKLRNINNIDNLQHIFNEAENKCKLIFFYVPWYGVEYEINESRFLESTIKKFDISTQSLFNKEKKSFMTIRCCIPCF